MERKKEIQHTARNFSHLYLHFNAITERILASAIAHCADNDCVLRSDVVVVVQFITKLFSFAFESRWQRNIDDSLPIEWIKCDQMPKNKIEKKRTPTAKRNASCWYFIYGRCDRHSNASTTYL